MGNDKYHQKIQHFLSCANININGDRPWDIQVHNEKRYPRVLAHGSLGLGESYMDGGIAKSSTSLFRVNQLWQIVLSPRGVSGGYCTPQ